MTKMSLSLVFFFWKMISTVHWMREKEIKSNLLSSMNAFIISFSNTGNDYHCYKLRSEKKDMKILKIL